MRVRAVVLATVAHLALALTVGCSSRPLSLEDEQQGDGGRSPNEPSRSPSAEPGSGRTCDRSPCPTGERCLPSCERLRVACMGTATGNRGQDAVCDRHEDCGAGFVCLVPLDNSMGGRERCLRHCRSNSECPSGYRCLATPLACQNDPPEVIMLQLCQTPPPAGSGQRRDGGT